MKNFKLYVSAILLGAVIISCETEESILQNSENAVATDENTSVDPNKYYYIGNDSVKGSERENYYEKKYAKNNKLFSINKKTDFVNSGYMGRLSIADIDPTMEVTPEIVADYIPTLAWNRDLFSVGNISGARQYDFTIDYGFGSALADYNFIDDLNGRLNYNDGAPFKSEGSSYKVRGIGHTKACYNLTDNDRGRMNNIYNTSLKPTYPLVLTNYIQNGQIHEELNPNNPGALDLRQNGFTFVGESGVIKNTSNSAVYSARILAVNQGIVSPNFLFYTGTNTNSTAKVNTTYTSTKFSFSIGVENGPISLGGTKDIETSATNQVSETSSSTRVTAAYIPSAINISSRRECKFKFYNQYINSCYSYNLISKLTGDLIGYKKVSTYNYGPVRIDPRYLLKAEDFNGVPNKVAIENQDFEYTIEYICRNYDTKAITYRSRTGMNWVG